MKTIKAVLACLALLAGSDANSQEKDFAFELTPFAGFAFGGEFNDMNGSDTLELEDDASFGAILNIRESANTQWEVLYSRQATEANTTALPIATPSLDIDVHYLHGGGTYQGGGTYARPYLAATLGATHFEPSLPGFDSETFFSVSIGAGLQIRPSDRFGIRLEARAFGTVLESDTELFCQTGPNANVCAITAEGEVLWQIHTVAGFVFRF